MKKLFAILLTIMLLLTACVQTEDPALPDNSSSEENSEPVEEEEKEPEPVETNSYEIADGFVYLEKGHVIEGDVKYADGKIFFRENQDGNRGEGKKGNVFSQDYYSKTEKAYEVYANSPIHYYNGNIYCSADGGIVKINAETGEVEKLLTFPEGKSCCASDGYKEYILYWEAEFNGAEDKKLYTFNTETGESKFLGDINHSIHPFGGSSFRIKNGFVAYCNTVYSEAEGGEVGVSETTYEFRAISLETGEDTLLYTSNIPPEKIAYDGKYLVWTEGGELYFIKNNGEKTKIADEVYDFDILMDNIVAYSVGSGNIYIRDLAVGQELFHAGDEDAPDRFSLNFTASEEGHFALICTLRGGWESEYYRELYPNWDWNQDSEFAELPNAVVPVYIYKYPENDAKVEEMFNFGEGVKAIELEVGREHFHIDCVLESEKYLLYTNGNIHRICDKETGEILHTEDYNSFCEGTLFPWRADFCTEKEGYDYRILFTDRVIYRSTEDFTKSETVMLTEYIPETSEFYKKQNTAYDINGENTFVNIVDGSVVIKKEGEEPKVILEKGYFETKYDFYKIAKDVPESQLKSEGSPDYEMYPISFYSPRFICNGKKLVAYIADEDDYHVFGTVVYNLETEKIEYCFHGSAYGYYYNRYPIDDRYIQYRDILWDAETGKSEKLPGKEFTVIPESDLNLLLYEEGQTLYMASPYYDFKGYIVNRETGEEFEFASTKEGGYPECYAVTENYYIIRVPKETNLEFYAVKFR